MNFSSPIWVKSIIPKIVPIRAFAAVFELVMWILGCDEDTFIFGIYNAHNTLYACGGMTRTLKSKATFK